MASPIGLFLLALVVRALPFPTVLVADRVTFMGMDAYYHLRRIHYALARFPETLDFDPYINFPHGARAIWPAFFDHASALLVLPVYRWGGLEAAEYALAWFPPLLGAATVWVVYFLALRCLGYATALLAGLLLSVLPAHFWYSQLGFLDHHAAVALAAALLLLSAVALIQGLSSPTSKPPPWGPLVALGVCLTLNLVVWPGSVLQIAVVQSALIVFLLTRPTAEAFAATARALALAQGLALALLLPATWGQQWERWSAFSPTVLSHFQPWLFAALLLFFGLALLLVRTRWGPRDHARPLPGLVVGIVLLALSFFSFPGLREGALEAWQWFAKDEAFQASVLESKPLFVVGGNFSTSIAEGRLSHFVYLLPFALAFLAWDTWRQKDSSARWLLLFYTLALAGTTLVQRRFFNSLSVTYAIVMAWTFVAVYHQLVSKGSDRVYRVGWAVALGALAIYLVIPLETSYSRGLANLARFYQGVPVQVRTAPYNAAVLKETANWIRENTPPTVGFLDATKRPSYGVLTLPGVGHLFEYEARRPVVSNNFGDDIGQENYSLARRYFAERNESKAQDILSQLDVRYIVATPPPAGKPRPRPAPMLDRLSYEDGSGLTGHRLVFEASQLGRRADTGRPTPKVFERVAGARVSGTAPSGQLVVAQLGLRTNRGRRLIYRQQARADEVGRYRLTLPYANDEPSGGISPEPAWHIKAQEQTQPLQIEQIQVVEGQAVTGPHFGP